MLSRVHLVPVLPDQKAGIQRPRAFGQKDPYNDQKVMATANGISSPQKVRTAPVWVKCLVLWHVFCITIWSCPKPSDKLLDGTVKPAPFAVGDWIRIYDEKTLKEIVPVKDYLFTTGTWQYWDMFAPNPANIDWWGDAIITYQDGTKKVSPYPRMALLSIPQKYLMERFRKFYERGHDDANYPYIFVSFVYRQALLNYTDPKNPPVEVDLRRHWKEVMPPDQKQETEYSDYIYYRGVIDKKILDLIKDGPP